MLEILLPEMCTISIRKYILLLAVTSVPALPLLFSLTLKRYLLEDEKKFRVKSHGLSLLSK